MHYTSIWYIWFLLLAIKHDDFQSLGFLQHIDPTRPMIQHFEDLAKQLGHAQRWQPRFQAKHSNEPCSEHTDSDFKCCRMLHKWDFTDFLFALLLPLACTSLWFGLVTIMASPRRTAWGLMSCPCWTMTNVWFNVPGKNWVARCETSWQKMLQGKRYKTYLFASTMIHSAIMCNTISMQTQSSTPLLPACLFNYSINIHKIHVSLCKYFNYALVIYLRLGIFQNWWP